MVAVLVPNLAELISRIETHRTPRSAHSVDLHIGIDDTDSTRGGCTAYTATLVFEELRGRGFIPIDFPWLVRLNPNIPWKTRGNGALSLHFNCEERRLPEIEDIVIEIVEKTSDPSIPSTDPAIAFLTGGVPAPLHEFSLQALHEVIRVKQAKALASKTATKLHTLGSSRGIIGSLAAIGYDMKKDHTFEIIAYRTGENCGSPRKVDLESVRVLDQKNPELTFNTVDPETGRVLICPHGPDPVLFGLRGDDPWRLIDAFFQIAVHEPVERVMIFKTNHGTDAHLTVRREIAQLTAHESSVVTGVVASHPIVVRGGHVIFEIRDESGVADCAVYEPTGSLRKIARDLIPGDIVRAFGGVRMTDSHNVTLNIEKLELIRLVEKHELRKPLCPHCGHSCESMGRNQGFRCRKCRTRLARDLLLSLTSDRPIKHGTYLAPARVHRHLTMPLSRYPQHWAEGRNRPMTSSVSASNS